MSDWQTLSSEEVYKTPWIRVRRDQVLNQNKKELTYSVVELVTSGAFIFAFNARGEMLLIKNFRYTVGKEFWEAPAGFIDVGEDALAAAKRELLEETGYLSDDWIEMGIVYQANGIGNIPGIYFLARDVYPSSKQRDKDEPITEQQFMSVPTIDTLVIKGEIEACLLAGLYLAKLHGITR